MPRSRFGLYFIPEGELYETGSRVLGFDIRRQQSVVMPDFIEPAWTALAREYGFHITITDAIEADSSQLPTIAQRVKEVLACLRPDNDYVLRKDRVGFWSPASDQAAVRLRPNRNVELLHDVLVATIHPLGRGSDYFERFMDDGAQYFSNSPAQVEKTRHFFAPYIFEEFIPHFTCINPFTGTISQRQQLERDLQHTFVDVDELHFDTLCMVAKEADKATYRLIETFDLRRAA